MMKRLQRVRKNEFARGVFILSSGTAVGQAAAVLAAPLITRLYTPEQFGQFAFFVGVVAMLTPLASLRYEWAVPLPAGRGQALDLMALCVALAAAFSVVCAIVALFVWPALARSFDVPDLAGSSLDLSLGVGVSSLLNAVNSWQMREHSFKHLALTRLITIVGTVLLQITFGYAGAGTEGLVWSFVLSYSGAVVFGGCGARSMPAYVGHRLTQATRLRKAASVYRAFALQTSPFSVVGILGGQLPAVVLPGLYGADVAGSYALAQRILGQPANFLGESISRVFWANAARLIRENPRRLWRLFVRLNAALMLVMLPGFALLFYGREIFALVFGSVWAEAGNYAGILFPVIFISLPAFATDSLSQYRLNHWQAGFECVRIGVMAVAFGATWVFSWQPHSCIVALSVGGMVAHGLLLLLNALGIHRAIKKGPSGQPA